METRTLCLAVLERGEASGYEIKKKLDEPPYSHFQDASFGSIYPALNRLAEEGAVAVRAEEQAKRPDKKVYSLTELGRRQFREALRRPPAEDRLRSDFLFLLFHGDLLAPERVLELVDGRIAALDAQVEQLTRCCPCTGKPMHDFLVELGIDHYRSSARFLRENRERLERMLTGAEAPVAE